MDERHPSNMYTAQTASDGSLRVRIKRSTEEEIPCQPNTSADGSAEAWEDTSEANTKDTVVFRRNYSESSSRSSATSRCNSNEAASEDTGEFTGNYNNHSSDGTVINLCDSSETEGSGELVKEKEVRGNNYTDFTRHIDLRLRIFDSNAENEAAEPPPKKLCIHERESGSDTLSLAASNNMVHEEGSITDTIEQWLKNASTTNAWDNQTGAEPYHR
ncbi:unnamed protein product [Ceratitis capitata]|uniref:(Mediterranean fruit fly) hypothetical protein n=1 Tax=Ceratitis capitata TaxID=7213 RepID=A0A811UEP2_CERCA|nr:unnamed protein product [Ceratitis capitata]